MQPDVKPFMTANPYTIHPGASALVALDLMVDHAIRHLPVVASNGRMCGILSFEDLRAALPVSPSLHHGLSLEERRQVEDYAVGEIMTYSVVALRHDDPLEEAVSTMLANRIGCLPVVDEEGRLEGILTETDLLEVLATMLWSERRISGEASSSAPELVSLLEQEAVHLRERLHEYEDEERAFTRMRREEPQDRVDLGSHAESAGVEGQLAELAAGRLRSIEEALERATAGEIDVCESCGGRIPEARLRALPGTRRCIGCARKIEKI